MVRQGQDLEAAIRRILIDSGTRFDEQANIAGRRVDFLVRAPDGDPLAILEAAAPTNERAPDTLRVKLLMASILERQAAHVPVILVVPDNLTILIDERRIVRTSGLVDRLRALGRQGLAQAAALIQPIGTGTVFASMPFSEAYIDTLKAITYATRRSGLVVNRVDHDGAADDVVQRIKDGIRAARLVVIDVSESRPSVLHEYGFAEALQKKIIAICSTDLGQLPFNIRNKHTESYVRGNILPLRQFLVRTIKDMLEPRRRAVS